MDKETAIARVMQYAAVVRQNFPVKKVILYGSHARGKAKRDSDIDVAIVVRRIEGDLLLSERKLFKLRRDIEPMIEPVLLEEDNDPSGFLAEILKTGEVIYSAD
jgi:predicted nucleotidyltransferase